VRHLSRSGYETSVQCLRKYYYQQLYRGTGLDRPIPEEYLSIGLALHAGMEYLCRAIQSSYSVEPDIRKVIMESTAPALEAIDAEWRKTMARGYQVAQVPEPDEGLLFLLDHYNALARAMFLAFVRTQALEFFSEWDPLLVEEEVPFELSSGLVMDTRADLVARSRSTGNLIVFNWKTFGTKSGFYEAYNRSIQMWTEACAVQRHLQEPVAGTIVVGFHKGSKKDKRYSSPLVWGYNREDLWSATYQRARGWEKVPMWLRGYELPNGDWGLPAWISWLPAELVSDQFLFTPPIPINEGAVEGWLPQVIQRETDLQHMLEAEDERDRERYFFQSFGKACNWCPYDPVCQGLTTPDAMLSDGVLVPREDHHAKEEKKDAD
jgi:hypothetical protein